MLLFSAAHDPDRFAPSCQATFAKAPQLTARHEIALKLGLDHGLLYRPHREWVDPAVGWIVGRPAARPAAR